MGRLSTRAPAAISALFVRAESSSALGAALIAHLLLLTGLGARSLNRRASPARFGSLFRGSVPVQNRSSCATSRCRRSAYRPDLIPAVSLSAGLLFSSKTVKCAGPISLAGLGSSHFLLIYEPDSGILRQRFSLSSHRHQSSADTPMDFGSAVRCLSVRLPPCRRPINVGAGFFSLRKDAKFRAQPPFCRASDFRSWYNPSSFATNG